MSPRNNSNTEAWLSATYKLLSGAHAICHPSQFQSGIRSWWTHVLAPEKTHSLDFRITLPPMVPWSGNEHEPALNHQRSWPKDFKMLPKKKKKFNHLSKYTTVFFSPTHCKTWTHTICMSSKVNLRPLRRFLKEETTTVALSLMPDTQEVLDGYLQLN